MLKKRLTAVFLISSILCTFALSSCKKNAEDTTSSSDTVATEETTTTTTTEETTTETTEAEEIDLLYDPSNPNAVNPITGVQDMDPANDGIRGVAIVVNNCYAAIPQRGITSADAIYEYETEGGQTRLLCVFADVNTVPEIGSIRSARIIASDLAAGTNSIFCHFGRNIRVPEHLAEYAIDHMDGNEAAGSYFWRDSTWLSRRALEHTAVTNGEHLADGIEHFNINTEDETPYLFNFVPYESTDLANGEACTEMNVYFSPVNDDALFEYDEETGTYVKSQYGGITQIDETTGDHLSITNVVVLYANIQMNSDGYTIDAYLTDGGDGYYASNGLIVPITWSKASPNDPIILYNEDGEELEVNRGMSYICIVDNDEYGTLTYS